MYALQAKLQTLDEAWKKAIAGQRTFLDIGN
jgi:hypothetical protein